MEIAICVAGFVVAVLWLMCGFVLGIMFAEDKYAEETERNLELCEMCRDMGDYMYRDCNECKEVNKK